jgi:hypothetical protein
LEEGVSERDIIDILCFVVGLTQGWWIARFGWICGFPKWLSPQPFWNIHIDAEKVVMSSIDDK